MSLLSFLNVALVGPDGDREVGGSGEAGQERYKSHIRRGSSERVIREDKMWQETCSFSEGVSEPKREAREGRECSPERRRS